MKPTLSPSVLDEARRQPRRPSREVEDVPSPMVENNRNNWVHCFSPLTGATPRLRLPAPPSDGAIHSPPNDLVLHLRNHASRFGESGRDRDGSVARSDDDFGRSDQNGDASGMPSSQRLAAGQGLHGLEHLPARRDLGDLQGGRRKAMRSGVLLDEQVVHHRL